MPHVISIYEILVGSGPMLIIGSWNTAHCIYICIYIYICVELNINNVINRYNMYILTAFFATQTTSVVPPTKMDNRWFVFPWSTGLRFWWFDPLRSRLFVELSRCGRQSDFHLKQLKRNSSCWLILIKKEADWKKHPCRIWVYTYNIYIIIHVLDSWKVHVRSYVVSLYLCAEVKR